MENEDKLDRVNEAIRYLKGNGIITKQQDIVDRMGYTKSSVSSALNGNEKYFTDNFIKSFNKAFDNIFNEEYLLEGFGRLLVEDERKVDVRLRLLTLCDQLKNEGKIHSNEEFSQIMGVSTSFLDEVLSGSRYIEDTDLENIAVEYFRFKEWLLTGQKSPFASGEFQFGDMKVNAVYKTNDGRYLIPSALWDDYMNFMKTRNDCSACKDKERLIESLEKQIELLENEILNIKKDAVHPDDNADFADAK